MHKFREDDAVQYVGSVSADLTGRSGIVIVQTSQKNVTVLFEGMHSPCGVLPSSLLLTKNADDLMPPVPDSVQYREDMSFKNTRSTLTVRPSAQEGQLLLELLAVQLDTGKYVFSGMRLDANDALDLAHDLTRMALKIKREEANG